MSEMIRLCCDCCNKEFDKPKTQLKPKNYCSRACRDEHLRQICIADGRTKIFSCTHCGTEFTRSASGSDTYIEHFCSHECRTAHRQNPNHPKRLKEPTNEVFARECQDCGITITYASKYDLATSISRGHKYCSKCAPKYGAVAAQRVKRKKALGLDPNKPFIERICPQCKITKIKYRVEKSALQAEERGVICRVCVNKNANTVPGYTQKRMANAMAAAHATNGVSKLELSIIDDLAAFGFVHSTKSGFTLGKYDPDFVNQEMKCIVEIFGDYWHCCEQMFPDPTEFVPQLNMTAEQRRQKDADKKAFYEQNGYSLIVLWESEVRYYLKRVKLLLPPIIHIATTAA